MEFNKVINELEAEITTGGKIQPNKVFIGGNIPANIPEEWKIVLKEILTILKTKGLLDSFSKDQDPIDISGTKPTGDVYLTADSGERYRYNVNSKKLFKA